MDVAQIVAMINANSEVLEEVLLKLVDIAVKCQARAIEQLEQRGFTREEALYITVEMKKDVIKALKK